jgi:uncharacterized membrane protein YciS (DUF1049 family)
MDFSKYLVDNAYVLVPVLYILGSIMKDSKFIADKYIPLCLLLIGILFACGWLGFNMGSVIQGVLITGITVYSNQVIKQLQKNEQVIEQPEKDTTDNKENTKIEATTTAVNSVVTQNSASANMEVFNPEHTVEDGKTVEAISASSPTA